MMNEKQVPHALVYSVAQAADALHVSDRHLRTLIQRGEIPYVKLGGRVVIRITTLEKLLADRERVGQ